MKRINWLQGVALFIRLEKAPTHAIQLWLHEPIVFKHVAKLEEQLDLNATRNLREVFGPHPKVDCAL